MATKTIVGLQFTDASPASRLHLAELFLTASGTPAAAAASARRGGRLRRWVEEGRVLLAVGERVQCPVRSNMATRRTPRPFRSARRVGDRSCPPPNRLPRVAVYCTTLLLVSRSVCANPIFVLPTEYGWVAARDHLVVNFAAVVISALSVEYLVFRHLFRRHLTGGKALVAFLDIHFVSWPITYALSLFLGLFNVFGLIPITEIFPIWYEGTRYRKLLRVRSVAGRKLMYRAAVVANFTSYIVGVVYLGVLGH